jgi:hypothetical protein
MANLSFRAIKMRGEADLKIVVGARRLHTNSAIFIIIQNVGLGRKFTLCL